MKSGEDCEKSQSFLLYKGTGSGNETCKENTDVVWFNLCINNILSLKDQAEMFEKIAYIGACREEKTDNSM